MDGYPLNSIILYIESINYQIMVVDLFKFSPVTLSCSFHDRGKINIVYFLNHGPNHHYHRWRGEEIKYTGSSLKTCWMVASFNPLYFVLPKINVNKRQILLYLWMVSVRPSMGWLICSCHNFTSMFLS